MSDIEWGTLPEDEIHEILNEGNAELVRRSQVETIPSQMVTLNAEFLAASGIAEGEPWVQPTGAHDAYPLDWPVTHVEKRWVSLVAANVWEPGVANWREDSGEEWPAWVQPVGSEDAYAAGAKVTHVEKHWTSDVDANVWEPGVYGWTEAAT